MKIENFFVSGVEDNFEIYYKNDGYLDTDAKDITIGYCSYSDNGAFPFIITDINNNIYFGDEGGSHANIDVGNSIISSKEYEKLVDDALATNNQKKMDLARELWTKKQEFLSKGVHGRLYKTFNKLNNGIPFNYSLLSFWGSLDGKDKYVNKFSIDKILKHFNVPYDRVLVVLINGFSGKLIPLNKWNHVVPPAQGSQKEAYLMHLMKPKEKHDMTSAFRQTRDKKIGNKLTNSKGVEMPLVQYHSMIYQENIKRQDKIIKEEIRKVTNRKYILEYLDTMTSDAMRSLGDYKKPSELSKQTYRYLRNDLYDKKRRDKVGIKRNSWLIHITTPNIGFKIMKEGFKSHIQDLNFRSTQDFEKQEEMSKNGLCFACELTDNDTWQAIIYDFEDNGNDWCGVIFQANGFNAWTMFGERNEVVFNANSAHNILLLLPMTKEEKEKYLKYNQTLDSSEMVKVIDKNGKVVMCGDMETIFHDSVSGSFENPTHNQKMENWLNNNLAQYKNNFGLFH